MELPAEGIVFMGDLLFVHRHPWLGDGDPGSWKKHLERFIADPVFKNLFRVMVMLQTNNH
jgi:hypothetical protein